MRLSRKFAMGIHWCGVTLVVLFVTMLIVEYVRSNHNMENLQSESVGIDGIVCIDGEEEMSVTDFLNQSSTHGHTYEIRGHFTKDIPENQFILLEDSFINVEFLINGETVLTTVDKSDPTYIVSRGEDALMVKSEGITTEDEILIRTTSDSLYPQDYNVRHLLNALAFGEGNFAVIRAFRDNSVAAGACLALVGVGVVLTIFFMLNFREQLTKLDFYLVVSADIVVGGIWCYYSVMGNYAAYYTGSKLVSYALNCILAPIMPVVLGLTIATMIYNRKAKTVTMCCVWVCTVVTIVLLCLEIFGVWNLGDSQIISYFFAIPILFCYAYAVYEAVHNRNKEQIFIVVLAAPAGVSSMFQITNTLFHFLDNTDLYIYGFLITLLIFTAYLLYGMQKIRTQLREIGAIKAELKQKEMDLMVSQVQPHFIFNSLNSIKALCTENPEQAGDAVSHFSKYLRINFESLNSGTPVALQTELECVENYLYLEKIRVGNRLKVVYDIQDEAIRLPALTIQPIAENAVRYGITKRAEGGTLTIRTEYVEDHHEITIEDTGIGFVVGEKKNDGHTHLGMENVKLRLKNMVNGTFTVESTPGVGTTVKMTIPDNGN